MIYKTLSLSVSILLQTPGNPNVSKMLLINSWRGSTLICSCSVFRREGFLRRGSWIKAFHASLHLLWFYFYKKNMERSKSYTFTIALKNHHGNSITPSESMADFSLICHAIKTFSPWRTAPRYGPLGRCIMGKRLSASLSTAAMRTLQTWWKCMKWSWRSPYGRRKQIFVYFQYTPTWTLTLNFP